MTHRSRLAAVLFLLTWWNVTPAWSDDQLRIATYNIEFLSAGISQARATQLKEVIAALNADIVGLEEIADRAALERVFDPTEWQLVIDDESNDKQDVAAAIRRPLRVISPQSLNADDEDFLFPDSQQNSNWPTRRDGLHVEIEVPGSGAHVHLVVIHAKARAGGRTATDSRRDGAARDLLSALEQPAEEQMWVLVGDFNDNPDDRSANILETGDPNALPGPEQIDGPFLFNLTESLLAEDHVSWGLSSANIVNGHLETRVPGSRQFNNATRGADSTTISPILFDQIVVSPSLHAHYVSGTVHVFDNAVAFQTGKASDHVPVYADFDLEGATERSVAPPLAKSVRIASLLPDPDGPDEGNEWVKLANETPQPIDVTGFRLRDRAGNVKQLEGNVPAHGEMEIKLAAKQLPLNNSGDDLELIDAAGRVIDRLSYLAKEVERGKVISRPTGAADAAAATSSRSDSIQSFAQTAAPVESTTLRPRSLELPRDRLALVSWNIQTGGTSTSKTAARPPMVSGALGRILDGNYQILAAQEIPSDDSAVLLSKLLPESGGPWQVAFTDTTSRMDNGFWFRKCAILNSHQTLFSKESRDPQGRLLINDKMALHPPHVGHFTVGDFDFTMITLHLTFKNGDSEESRREMSVLLDFLDDYFSTEGNDPDVIICGDFNLPSDTSGQTANELTLDQIIHEDGRFEGRSRGLTVLVDEPTSRSPKSKGGTPARNYDHFILSSDCLEEFISASRLSPSVLTADPADPEETLTSDHLPIVSFFKTSGAGISRDLTAIRRVPFPISRHEPRTRQAGTAAFAYGHHQ